MTLKTEIIDSGSLVPTFADRLAAVQQVGAMTHLCFTAAQPVGTVLEHVLQARIVVPTTELKAIATAILAGQVVTVPPVPRDIADAMVQ